MAYSNVQYIGNGVTKTYYVPFQYLAQDHVKVSVNGTLLTAGAGYTWTSSNAITLTAAPGNGLVVDISRSTSPTTRLVDFQDGSTLTQEILDLNSDQLFYLSQENLDGFSGTLKTSSDGTLDAKGRRISNVGLPVNPGDVVTKQTIDTIYPAVNTVVANASNVNIVASDLASNFGHVTDLGSITESTTTSPPVTTSRIDTIITNLPEISTVTDNMAGINAVASHIDGIGAVIDHIGDISLLASDLGYSVAAVADLGSITDSSLQPPGTSSRLDDIMAHATDIHTVATNITNIINAPGYASTASTGATNAAASASAAATSATNAATSASSASGSATASSSSASSASSSAASASTSASLAGDWAVKTTGAVSGTEYSAKYHAQQAASSATNASTSASSAATSATNAATSATAASTSATAASGSATSASGSATAAASSASSASTSATNASNSASAAATSATNAATSATSASTSASTATTQAGVATTKATDASSAATAAAAAQAAAETARDQTLAAYDSFDDRYLGTKAVDPTLDNDGNPLVAGALYFSSASGTMKVYTGTAWVAAYASLSGALLVTNNLSDLGSVSAARTNLGLASVAASGAYSDLTGKPTAVSSFTNDASYITASGARTAISVTGSLSYNNTTGVISYTAPTLATVATSGAYSDLTGKPTAVSSFTNDSGYITQAGARSAVSVTGSLSYNSTTGVISYTAPTLATVATSGAYSDLTGKPTAVSSFTNDSAYVNQAGARSAISATGSLSYNSTTGVISYTAPTLATVATSGSYTDLSNKPTLGSLAAKSIVSAADLATSIDLGSI